jgi:hypothetical protein
VKELAVRIDRVTAPRGTLEPVKKHRNWRVIAGRRRDVDIEEIAVRRVQANAFKWWWSRPAQQPSGNRLSVGRGQPPGRMKRLGLESVRAQSLPVLPVRNGAPIIRDMSTSSQAVTEAELRRWKQIHLLPKLGAST